MREEFTRTEAAAGVVAIFVLGLVAVVLTFIAGAALASC